MDDAQEANEHSDSVEPEIQKDERYWRLVDIMSDIIIEMLKEEEQGQQGEKE